MGRDARWKQQIPLCMVEVLAVLHNLHAQCHPCLWIQALRSLLLFPTLLLGATLALEGIVQSLSQAVPMVSSAQGSSEVHTEGA